MESETELTKFPIIEGKRFCNTCKIYVVTKAFEKHLISKRHKGGITKDEPKIKCECGGVYYRALFPDHEQTDKHIYYMNKIERQNRRKELYEQNKDTKRCCSNCLKIDINEFMYIEDLKLCKTCDEILKNVDKICTTCRETKNITLFEKPALYRCKDCAAKKAIENYHIRNTQNS